MNSAASLAPLHPAQPRTTETPAPAREDDRNAWAAALIAEMRKGAKATGGRAL